MVNDTLNERDDLPEDLDPEVRPQDDFWAFVNGSWVAEAEMPDDRAVHGTFHVLADRSQEHVRDIIDACAATVESGDASDDDGLAVKIGAVYASFMDTDTLDALGATPIAPTLAQVAEVTSRDDLLSLLGHLRRSGVGGLLSSGIWIDRGDPSRYLLHVSQSGLGLPDESYYREEDKAELRADYVAHIARMLLLCGAAEDDGAATSAAGRIMALETQIAAAHWDRAANRDAVNTYNVLDEKELITSLRGADDWLDAIGVPATAREAMVIAQPDVVTAVDDLLESVDLTSWQDWLRWRIVRGAASYLSTEIDEANFAFYGTRLTGAKTQRERWRRGVNLVEALLGEAVGRLYVQEHYPPRSHEMMQELVDNLLQAYRERIERLDWMQAETRERALAKLELFTPKIGQPVRWRDYDDLEVHADDLLGNVWRATASELQRDLDKLAEPVDRDEWFMTPQTVNAYYNPTLNEIVFPAAILQPPFFDADVDPAYNYGAIGAVIGHEIGHGFDDQGSRYDGDGRLSDWWTPADRKAFEARADALKTQYDVLSPRELEDTYSVNGSLTVGENIGDLGGVAVALHAYRLSLGGQEAPVVDGLTGEQRFFVGWARVWRSIIRPEEAIRRLAIDPHSPAEFRVSVVRNVDAFHEAFGVDADDAMWLAPEERVAIW